jgi:hypothetical protein
MATRTRLRAAAASRAAADGAALPTDLAAGAFQRRLRARGDPLEGLSPTFDTGLPRPTSCWIWWWRGLASACCPGTWRARSLARSDFGSSGRGNLRWSIPPGSMSRALPTATPRSKRSARWRSRCWEPELPRNARREPGEVRDGHFPRAGCRSSVSLWRRSSARGQRGDGR